MGSVATARGKAQHSRVAAGQIDESWRDVGEELLDERSILEHAKGLASRGNAALFTPPNESVSQPLRLFGSRMGRGNLPMEDEVPDQPIKQSASLFAGPRQSLTAFPVSHRTLRLPLF